MATINDVARIAGVSKRTVSRVINNSPMVNQATRDKINAVIKELDYAPSPQARGLAFSRSYLMGLIYDDPNALSIHAIQRGILNICLDKGYELIVRPFDHQSATLAERVIHFIQRSKLDGVILLPPLSADEGLVAALRAGGYNYVRIGNVAFDALPHLVYAADRESMADLSDYLVSLGHRNIAVIAGPPSRIATTERLEGFQQGLMARGVTLRDDDILIGDFTYDAGVRLGTKLLSRESPPTAIFALNDEMAAGVLQAARKLGLDVPGDVSVAGYDDSPLATKIYPALTTFHRPNARLAEQAVQKLLQQIGLTDDEVEIEGCFRPELILRQSTGPVRQ